MYTCYTYIYTCSKMILKTPLMYVLHDAYGSSVQQV